MKKQKVSLKQLHVSSFVTDDISRLTGGEVNVSDLSKCINPWVSRGCTNSCTYTCVTNCIGC